MTNPIASARPKIPRPIIRGTPSSPQASLRSILVADITIARQTLTKVAAAPTFTALNATDVYYVLNDTLRLWLYFKNTNAGIATITFDVTKLVDGLAIADLPFTIPATTGERVLGAFPASMQVESGAHSGKLKFACDLATGVSIAAFTT